MQHFRHSDAAVVPLVVLDDRDDRPADRDRCSVQRVHVPRRLALGGPLADVEAAGLEVGRVGGRGELAEAALPGQPGLEVVLLRRRCAEVVDGDVDDAVGKLERSEDLLLYREQALVLLARDCSGSTNENISTLSNW